MEEAARNLGNNFYTVTNAGLLRKLALMRQDNILTDIRFVFRDGSEAYAHKAIMVKYSPVIASRVSAVGLKAVLVLYCANLDSEQEVYPHIMKHVLDFMYGHKVHIPSWDIQQTMRLAVKLDMKDLVSACDSILLHKKTEPAESFVPDNSNQSKNTGGATSESTNDTQTIIYLKKECPDEDGTDQQPQSGQNDWPMDIDVSTRVHMTNDEKTTGEQSTMEEMGTTIPTSEIKVEAEDSLLTEEETHEDLDGLFADYGDPENYWTNNEAVSVREPSQDPCPGTSSSSSSSNRFCSLSMMELEKIAINNEEQSTRTSTKWAVKIFKDYLNEKGKSIDFEALEMNDLASILYKFYGDLRKKNKDKYSKSALVSIRAGIQRHLQLPPYSKMFSIISDREFKNANLIFTGYIKQAKKERQVIHKEKITDDDMRLIRTHCFGKDRPDKLMNKVFFDILVFFGRRSREGLRDLRRDSFEEVTVKGKTCYKMAYSEYDKNHQVMDPKEIERKGLLIPTGTENCPVLSFKLYMSKLNKGNPVFFQQPNKNYHMSGKWFTEHPMGKTKLGHMMKSMSREAGCSTIYTNHCVQKE